VKNGEDAGNQKNKKKTQATSRTPKNRQICYYIKVPQGVKKMGSGGGEKSRVEVPRGFFGEKRGGELRKGKMTKRRELTEGGKRKIGKGGTTRAPCRGVASKKIQLLE